MLSWKSEPEAPLAESGGGIWGKGNEYSLNTYWRPGPVQGLHAHHSFAPDDRPTGWGKL